MWCVFLGLVPLIVVGRQDPTFGADGVLHAHHANSLYAINTDGSTAWIFDGGAPLGAHAEGLEGTVYVTRTEEDTLFALDSVDGTIKWKHYVEPWKVVDDGNPLAVATDGTIYLVSFVLRNEMDCYSTSIDAIDANGTLRWTSSMAGCGKLSLVGADGTLFLMTLDDSTWQNTITALQHDTGKVKWSVGNVSTVLVPSLASEMAFEAAVSFAEDGSVFLLQCEQNCSRLFVSRFSNEDGRILWKVPLSVWPDDPFMSRFVEVGSKNEVYVNGMSLNGTCSLRVFDFDGIPLRNLPCLKHDTVYGDEEDVFVSVFDPGNDGVRRLWAQTGSNGHLLWTTSFGHAGPHDNMDGDAMRFGHDGTIFAWDDEFEAYGFQSQMHALRKGDTLWSVDMHDGHDMRLLMSADGTTYVQGSTSSEEIEIVAVAVDGVEKWRYQPTEALAEFV